MDEASPLTVESATYSPLPHTPGRRDHEYSSTVVLDNLLPMSPIRQRGYSSVELARVDLFQLIVYQHKSAASHGLADV